MNVAAIPQELRERAQWVLWRLETRDGKQTKVPVRADGRGRASSTNPETWATFDEAVAASATADGIGFVFSADDPFVGIDLDAGLKESDRGAIVSALDSYAETSISGNGVHVIVRANLNGSRRRSGPFEVYDAGRFFVVTGEHVRGTPTTIEERQAQLEHVLERFLPAAELPNGGSKLPPQPVTLDDRELLDRAFESRNGSELRDLYEGRWEGRYPSHSEADQALANRLAFWCGRDPERIDRVFRASGLYRPKWDRDDYRNRTIENAIAACPETYSPAPQPRPSTSSQPRPQVTSSLVPTPSGGDEDEHLVPNLVPSSHSWQPRNLVERAANPPAAPQIIDLLYPGYNHLISGESEALKTWLMLAAAAAELTAGRGVLWVDADDVGEGAVLERLRLLGADDDAISSRFAYVLPEEPLDEARVADVLATVKSVKARFAVMDGFNPLMALHGLNPDSGTDVEQMYRLLNPVRRHGVAVAWTDNVVKSREARGAWAIGSERKKSKAEVHLGMTRLVPLVRGGTGKAKIDVHKDRPGHLERPSPGMLVVEAVGEKLTWRVQRDESRDDAGDFRPTALMEKLSRFLERKTEPQSRNQIEAQKLGKAEYVRKALDQLVREGYVAEFEGRHGARLVRFERSFREDEDA